MRLIRFGAVDKEKPGILLANGKRLDVSAFCVGEDGQIPEMGDFVFYGSENQTKLEGEDEPRPYSSDGSVYGAIDETEGDDDGDDDEGDTEDMRIYFDRVADHIKEIVVVVTITKYPNDEPRYESS